MIKFSLFLLLFFSLNANAQNWSLEGIWKCDWVATYARGDQAEKTKFNEASPSTRSIIQAGFASRQYNFNDDGTFVFKRLSNEIVRQLTGHWTMNVDKTSVTLTIGGELHHYIISWISTGTVALTPTETPIGALFPTFVLTKN